MILYALAGAVIAGIYGIIHDQITFTLSSEYFTKMKFDQFDYADFGLSPRFHVGTIGFLATWWVGLVIGWFLGRRYIPGVDAERSHRIILSGFAIVFVCSILAGVAAGAFGAFSSAEDHLPSWSSMLRSHDIDDGWAFVRVAYIHNSGYLGGLVGLLIALFRKKPVEKE